jgi:hypothetical protein
MKNADSPALLKGANRGLGKALVEEASSPPPSNAIDSPIGICRAHPRDIFSKEEIDNADII